MHASVPEPLHRKHDASHAEHCFSPVSADVVPYVPASHWSMQRPLVLSHGRGESAEQDVHDVEEDGALHVLHSFQYHIKKRLHHSANKYITESKKAVISGYSRQWCCLIFPASLLHPYASVS